MVSNVGAKRKAKIWFGNKKYYAIRSRICAAANLLINMLLKLMMFHLFMFVLSSPVGFSAFVFMVGARCHFSRGEIL